MPGEPGDSLVRCHVALLAWHYQRDMGAQFVVTADCLLKTTDVHTV